MWFVYKNKLLTYSKRDFAKNGIDLNETLHKLKVQSYGISIKENIIFK